MSKPSLKIRKEAQWVIETFSDADWAANRGHRRSTSCGFTFEWKLFVPKLENTKNYFFVVVRERTSINCFIDV